MLLILSFYYVFYLVALFMAIKRVDFIFVSKYMNTLADEFISFYKFCGLGEVKVISNQSKNNAIMVSCSEVCKT